MSAPRRALVVLGVALSLLAACGGGGSDDEASTTVEPSGWGVASADPTEADDDPTPTTAPAAMRGTGDEKPDPSATTTTTGPAIGDAEAVACRVLTAGLLVPVALDDPEPPSAEEEQAEILALADTLATSGPEILRPGARRLQELVPVVGGAAPGAPTPEEEAAADEVLGLVDNLLAWTGSTCDLDVMAWACATHSTFHAVGEQIGGEDDPVDTSSPEGVAEAHQPGGVEVDRTDDRVLYAWVDDHGMVVDTLEAERRGDAWAVAATGTCT